MFSDNPSIRRCKLYLLRGTCPVTEDDPQFHNRVFRFWRDFWRQVFADNGTYELPQVDDFLRQDTISVITCGAEIAAMACSSQFNLGSEAAKNHPYLIRAGETFIHSQCKKGRQRLMTIEHLAVGRDFRKQMLGISLASVLIGLKLRLFHSLGANLCLGMSRSDVKVDRILSDFGAVPVSPTYMLHGTPCVNMAFFPERITGHRDPAIESAITYLWQERRDLIHGPAEERAA